MGVEEVLLLVSPLVQSLPDNGNVIVGINVEEMCNAL
jgi:hypothetical protein